MPKTVVSGNQDSKAGVSDSRPFRDPRSLLREVTSSTRGTPKSCLSEAICSALASSEDGGWALSRWEAPVIPAVRQAFPEQIWGLKPGQVRPWRRQGPAW